MKDVTRPAIFKWRQTAPEVILCTVRWYLRYSLSLRDVEELLTERGLEADHTTIGSVASFKEADKFVAGRMSCDLRLPSQKGC